MKHSPVSENSKFIFLKKALMIVVATFISYSSYSQYFSRPSTTIYPTTSGDKIGLGTITTASAFTHYGVAQGEYPIIIQPSNYGTAYPYVNNGMTSTTADRFYIGGYGLYTTANSSYDNRPDVVGNLWAYNMNYAGARINSTDGGFRFATETHYFINGANPSFEFHFPEVVLYNGTTVRTSSLYQNKATGLAFKENRIDAETWYSVRTGTAGIGVPMVGISSALGSGLYGDITLYGETAAAYGGRLFFSHGSNGYSLIWGEGSTLVLNSYGLGVFGMGSSSSVMAKGFLGVGGSGNPVDFNGTKAMFEVQSTTKGSLPAPRMTATQRNAITSPPEGLMIYNLTTHEYNYYNGTAWKIFGWISE